MKLKRLAMFFLVVFCLSLLSVFHPVLTGNSIDGSLSYEPEIAYVLRIVDGDTIETDLGTIRLLGINTPEKNMPGYSGAKNFLSQIENQSIEILRDYEDTDKYGRKLRYVFYDSRFLNVEILENGLASAYVALGLKYEKQILRAENYSRENEIGIWKRSNHVCADCIILLELNATAEFFIIKNQCNFDCSLEGWFVKDAGRNVFKLSAVGAGVEQKIESKKSVWNDDGDKLFIYDNAGMLAFYYSY